MYTKFRSQEELSTLRKIPWSETLIISLVLGACALTILGMSYSTQTIPATVCVGLAIASVVGLIIWSIRQRRGYSEKDLLIHDIQSNYKVILSKTKDLDISTRFAPQFFYAHPQKSVDAIKWKCVLFADDEGYVVDIVTDAGHQIPLNHAVNALSYGKVVR